MATHLLAIDQGTTSTRAFLFDAALSPVGFAQLEFPQIFPQPGWVEHDPQGIWTTSVATARAAMASAGVSAEDVAAIGITNQRETTIIWDRKTGKPIHNAIVWQDRRTHEACAALARAGHEKLVSERTGLLLDPYFSATKIAWLLDNVSGARAAAEAGRLAFGTVDTYLLWHFTGGKVHATDATNAARTALLDIRTGQVGRRTARPVPRTQGAASRGARLRFRLRNDPAPSARRASAHPRHRGRSAGRDHRARLLQAGHDEIDLRHRLLRAAQYRRHAGAVARPHAHHHRVSAQRQAHLCAGGRDLHCGRRGAMAARRAQADRDRGRDRHDRGAVRPGGRGLSGAGLCRARRTVVGCRGARRALWA